MISKKLWKKVIDKEFNKLKDKVNIIKKNLKLSSKSNVLDDYGLIENFIPYKKALGGRFEWIRKDESKIGKTVNYILEGEKLQYIIRNVAGNAHMEITDKGMKSVLSDVTYAEKGIMTAVVDEFELAPDLQGKGLGTRLWIERLESKAKEYKVKIIIITHVMSTARNFWKKVGLVPKFGNEIDRTWIKNI
jgi:GNAT superfamily N-acetyltransferase